MKNEKRYSWSFKLKCINTFLENDDSISRTARDLNLKKQTLARWIRQYSQEGKAGLKNKRSGAKVKRIDPKTKKMVLQLWQEKNMTAYSMRKLLKTKGITISEYSIRKIYKCHNLYPS